MSRANPKVYQFGLRVAIESEVRCRVAPRGERRFIALSPGSLPAIDWLVLLPGAEGWSFEAENMKCPAFAANGKTGPERFCCLSTERPLGAPFLARFLREKWDF